MYLDYSQDTSLIQYRLAKELSKASGACLSVVGDPDQLCELFTLSRSNVRSADVSFASIQLA
jgi:hypothetical protein